MRRLSLKLFRRLTVMSIVMALIVIRMVGVDVPITRADSSNLACVFDAPLGAGGLGHVGWGFQINSSTFLYGSTEDPNTNFKIVSDGNGGYRGIDGLDRATGPTTPGSWSRQGSFAQMLNDFQQQPQWGTWPQASLDAQAYGNEYTQYKCLNVTNSNVTNAENGVTVLQNSGYYPGAPGGGSGASPADLYSLAGWNCMNQVDYILSEYNLQGLPSPNNAPDYAPNSWFNDINTIAVSINGATYSVTGADSSGLAVYQNGPDGAGGNVLDHVPNGTSLIVVCQTIFGAQEDGLTIAETPLNYTTWDMLADGTFVYGWYVNTPAVQADGYSHIPGVPACVSDGPSSW